MVLCVFFRMSLFSSTIDYAPFRITLQITLAKQALTASTARGIVLLEVSVHYAAVPLYHYELRVLGSARTQKSLRRFLFSSRKLLLCGD